MRNPQDIRAEASALYNDAKQSDSADDSLLYIFRALELEDEAARLERESRRTPQQQAEAGRNGLRRSAR